MSAAAASNHSGKTQNRRQADGNNHLAAMHGDRLRRGGRNDRGIRLIL